MDLIEKAAEERYNTAMVNRSPELVKMYGRSWARWEDLTQANRDLWIDAVYEEMRY